MSLESERRAIGTRLTESRAAIRDSMRASRASTFKRDLNALESGSRKVVDLSKVEPRGARPAGRGVAYYVPPDTTGSGGIASPVTETSYAAREFYSSQYVTTSDGMFVLEIEPVKKIVMLDADGGDFVQEFAAP